ncbi:Hypothetical protein NTJ_03586 [Nesidiocoris tenuis]|uniref:Transmembrane protein n=1 Tax=Nesidiocoris tenuis TaxID=355587 RepID=A0ABN7AES5_9HEMI|nr:Hypothetical protein NTJ_03586 [Nesidiocoris tenuis]
MAARNVSGGPFLCRWPLSRTESRAQYTYSLSSLLSLRFALSLSAVPSSLPAVLFPLGRSLSFGPLVFLCHGRSLRFVALGRVGRPFTSSSLTRPEGLLKMFRPVSTRSTAPLRHALLIHTLI